MTLQSNFLFDKSAISNSDKVGFTHALPPVWGRAHPWCPGSGWFYPGEPRRAGSWRPARVPARERASTRAWPGPRAGAGSETEPHYWWRTGPGTVKLLLTPCVCTETEVPRSVWRMAFYHVVYRYKIHSFGKSRSAPIESIDPVSPGSRAARPPSSGHTRARYRSVCHSDPRFTRSRVFCSSNSHCF